MQFSSASFVGFTSAALVLVSVSCGTLSKAPGPQRPPERKLYQWSDDGGTGTVSVKISLSDQIAEFKRGGREIGWCYVATGKEGHSTRAGKYSITEKIEDKHSNIYGWIEDAEGNVTDGDAKATDRVPKGMTYVPAPMPCWMRLTSYGVGMHGGLIPEPGEPASHGCIRIPKAFVSTLFDSVEVGTPVTITNASSSVNPGSPSPEPELETKTEIEFQEERETPRVRLPSTVPRRHPNQSAQSVTYRNGVPVFD